VTGMVTETGIVYPPFDLNLRRAVRGEQLQPLPGEAHEPEPRREHRRETIRPAIAPGQRSLFDDLEA